MNVIRSEDTEVSHEWKRYSSFESSSQGIFYQI